MNYKISETLTLELQTGDDSHWTMSRKDGGRVRIEINETGPLLATFQKATFHLLYALLREQGIGLVEIEGEGDDAGFILPFACNYCGDGVVFVNRSEAGEWSMNCDNCGKSWTGHNVGASTRMVPTEQPETG